MKYLIQVGAVLKRFRFSRLSYVERCAKEYLFCFDSEQYIKEVTLRDFTRHISMEIVGLVYVPLYLLLALATAVLLYM